MKRLEDISTKLSQTKFQKLVHREFVRNENLKFRTKKQNSQKVIDKQCCDICIVGYDKYIGDIYYDQGFLPIYCYGCNISCHLQCYGRNTPIQKIPDQQMAYFVCDRCNIDYKVDSECVVCFNKGGLKKRITNTNEMVHPSCGLMSRNLVVDDYLDMNFSRTQKQVPITHMCTICKHKGADLNCNHDNCNSYVHYNCVLQQLKKTVGGYTKEFGDIDEQKLAHQWSIEFLTEPFLNLETVEVGAHRVLGKEILELADSKIREFQTIEQELDQPQKRRGKANNKKKETISEARRLLSQYFDQYNSRMPQNNTNQQHSNAQIMNVLCSNHRKPQEFCICHGVETADLGMISCDCCMDWYHYECIGENPDKAKNELYVCQSCEDWNKFKFDVILQGIDIEKVLKCPNYQNQIEVNRLIPRNKRKIQMSDLISYVILCQRIFEFFDLDRFHENLFILVQGISSIIPFSNVLVTQLADQRKKSYLADFLDSFLASYKEYRNDKLFQMESQFDVQNRPIESKIKINKHIGQILDRIIILFKDLEECKFYENLQSQYNTLEVIRNIITSQNKIQKRNFKQQIAELESPAFNNVKLNEINWMLQQKSQYLGLKEQFKSLFRDKLEDCKQLQSQLHGLLLVYIDQDEELFPVEAAKLGIHIKLGSYEDYFQMLVGMYLLLDSHKPQINDIMSMIQQGRDLVFDIPWLRDLSEELEKQVMEYEQSKDMDLNMNNLVRLDEYLNMSIESIIASPHSRRIYEGLSKIKAFEYQIQILREIFENSSIPEDSDSQQQVFLPRFQSEFKVSFNMLDEFQTRAIEIGAPEEDKKFLQSIRELTTNQQQAVIKILSKDGFNESIRRKVRSEVLKNNRFDLPEIQELENRCQKLQEISEMMNKRYPLQQFYEAKQTVIDQKLDEKYLTYFVQEINKAESFKEQIKEFLSNGQLSKEKYKQVKKLLQQLGTSKAEIPLERKLLQDYIASHEFIEETYKLYERLKSYEHVMEMEFDKSVDYQLMIRQVIDPFSILFEESKPVVQEIVKLNTKYEGFSHSDPQVAEVANNYLQFAWFRQAQSLLSMMNSEQKMDLEQVELITKNLDHFYKIDDTLYGSISTLKTQVDQLLCAIHRLIDQDRVSLILLEEVNLQEWLQEYMNLEIKFTGGALCQLETVNAWVHFTSCCLRTLQSTCLTPNSLFALREMAQVVQVPSSSNQLRKINYLLERAMRIYGELQGYERDREAFIQYISSSAMQKHERPLRKKTTAAFARTLLASVKEQPVILNCESLKRDLNLLTQLQSEFLVMDPELGLGGSPIIQNTLQSLQDQLCRLPLSDSELSDQITLKLLNLKITSALNGENRLDQEKANRYLIKIQSLLKQPSDLVNEMKEQLGNAEQVDKRFKQLLLVQKKLNHQDRQEIKINSQDLQDLIKKCEEIRGLKLDSILANLLEYQTQSDLMQLKYLNIVKRGKVPFSEVDNLYKQMKYNPIYLEEEKLLQDQIKHYENLKIKFSSIQQQINSNGRGIDKNLTQFTQDYQFHGIIQITEAEHFLREQRDFLVKVRSLAKRVNQEGEDIQLLHEFNELKAVFRWGTDYEALRLNLWMKNTQRIRRTTTPCSCNLIKMLLQQGYDILDSMINHGRSDAEHIKENLQYLEQLSVKIKNYLLFLDPNDQDHLAEGRIEVYENILELKDLSRNEKIIRLEEQFKVRRPFDDLPSYRAQRELQNHQQRRLKPQEQRVQAPKLVQDNRNSNKRKVVAAHKDSEFVYDKVHVPREQDSSAELPKKKVKTELPESKQEHILNGKGIKSDKKQIPYQIRERTKIQLLHIIQQNNIFSVKDENFLNSRVREIENQIFGNSEMRKSRYTILFESIVDLLGTLRPFPNISMRILKKNFSWEVINSFIKRMQNKNLQEAEVHLQQMKEKQYDLKFRQQLPYNPLNVKPVQPAIPLKKVNPIIPKAVEIPLSYQKKTPKSRLVDSDDDIMGIKDPFAGLNKKTKQEPTKLKDDVLDKLLEPISSHRRVSPPAPEPPQPQPQTSHKSKRSNTDSSSSSSSSPEPRRRKRVKKSNRQRSPKKTIRRHRSKSSSSSSSDLPEYHSKVVATTAPTVAILYDPDQNEQDKPIPAPQPKPKAPLSPLEFQERVLRIGRARLRPDSKSDKKLKLEFFIREQDVKTSDLPSISQELKMNNYQTAKLFSFLESKINMPNFRMLVGWVYPEHLKDLEEVNRYSDEILATGSLQIQYQTQVVNFMLLPLSQLKENPLFKNLQVPEPFILQSRRKDEQLVKYWGHTQSKLGFIYYAKDSNINLLSDFKGIKEEEIELADVYQYYIQQKTESVRKWVERRKEEINKSTQHVSREKEMDKSRQSEKAISYSASEQFAEQISQEIVDDVGLEPVTSEEGEDNEQQMPVDMDNILRMHLGVGEQLSQNRFQPTTFSQNQQYSNWQNSQRFNGNQPYHQKDKKSI